MTIRSPKFPSPAENPPTAPPRLPALDGARGIAVLLVLLDHASDAEMQIIPGVDLNRAGKYGVYLFFVLSAFLLTEQFARWRAQDFTNARRWLAYGFRRFIRIFPIYAAVLIAYVLMGKLELAHLASHLLLREGEKQFWTIPVECKYYVLLPLIAGAIFWAGRKSRWLGAAAGVGVLVVGLGLHTLDTVWSLRPEVLLFWSLPPFLLGSALAVVYAALQRHPERQRQWAPWLKLAAVGAALTLLLRLPFINEAVYASPELLGKEYDPVVCGVLWSIFLLGSLQPGGVLAAVMQWLPLRYLGMISFSAYLWHRKFVNDVDDFPAASPVRLLVFLALVIAVSSISYFAIERPLQKLRWPAPREPR